MPDRSCPRPRCPGYIAPPQYGATRSRSCDLGDDVVFPDDKRNCPSRGSILINMPRTRMSIDCIGSYGKSIFGHLAFDESDAYLHGGCARLTGKLNVPSEKVSV